MLSLHELLWGNMTAKAQATKERKKEIDFTEVKSFKNKYFFPFCVFYFFTFLFSETHTQKTFIFKAVSFTVAKNLHDFVHSTPGHTNFCIKWGKYTVFGNHLKTTMYGYTITKLQNLHCSYHSGSSGKAEKGTISMYKNWQDFRNFWTLCSLSNLVKF